MASTFSVDHSFLCDCPQSCCAVEYILNDNYMVYLETRDKGGYA